jgi:hypothetical protein
VFVAIVWVVLHSKNWPAVKQGVFFNRGGVPRQRSRSLARKFVSATSSTFLIAEVVILERSTLLIAALRSLSRGLCVLHRRG